MNHNYLPILMYHAIRSAADRALPPTASIEHAVETGDFRAQLDTIVDCGYHTIKLKDLDRPLAEPKSVLITFDDGHQSDLLEAAPELARRNLHAIFFVIWSYIGRPGYMTRDQVLALQKQGFEIGSHGLTHVRLTQISVAEAANELRESKRQLEGLLQEPIAALAIPFGYYNDRVIQAAWAAGYWRVMTSDFRIAKRKHRVMPRMGPMADTTSRNFKWMLEASRAAAVGHHAIDAIGVRLRRLNSYADALLARA
jgi:peptidoglycan/xylan/chitin deacetylase (PgdA/CDA1 family)